MHRTTKIWLIIATFFVILGAAMFAAIMIKNQWNFREFGTTEYATNTHLITQNFDDIHIQSDTADIIFVPSKDTTCRVVCVEPMNEKHIVNVENQTLSISVTNEKKWYDHIGITFDSPQLTIYLPEAQYNQLLIAESTGDIKIPKDFHFENMEITTSAGDIDNNASTTKDMTLSTDTGDIFIENIRAKNMSFCVSTGEILGDALTCEDNMTINVTTGATTLTDVTCASLSSSGSTGDITLRNVIATDTFSIIRSTGDVKFDRSDAAELFIETDTGDVTGSLLTDKVFFIETSTGDVHVPKLPDGGACDITTSTGDIKITIE